MRSDRTEKQSHAILERVREMWTVEQWSTNERFLMTILASHSNGSDQCWPTHETIAELSGLSVGSVKRILKGLRRKGAFTTTGMAHKGRSTVYRLLPVGSYGEDGIVEFSEDDTKGGTSCTPNEDGSHGGDNIAESSKGGHKGGHKGGTPCTPQEKKKRSKERTSSCPDDGPSFREAKAYQVEHGIDREAAQAWWEASNRGTVDANGRKLKCWKKALLAYAENFRKFQPDRRTFEELASHMGLEPGTEECDRLELFCAQMELRNDGSLAWRIKGRPVVDKATLYKRWVESDPSELSWIESA